MQWSFGYLSNLMQRKWKMGQKEKNEQIKKREQPKLVQILPFFFH